MKYILKYRILIIITLALLTVFAAVHLNDLTRDAGVSALLPEDHPDYLYWKEMEEVFGATDQAVIGITTPEGIYTPEALTCIHELTHFLETRDEIDEDDVVSLTNVDDMQGADGELLIEPLVDTDGLAALDTETLETIRQRIRTNPLFAGKLVSADEHSAVIVAGVPTEVSMKEEEIAALKAAILQKIDAMGQRYPEITLNLSGPAMLKAFISETMQADMKTLFPLAILVVMLMLLLLLRSVYGMVIPVLVTLFSIVWTLGLKGWLGSPLTIVETTIPIMLIAIGCADGVHIISEFFGFSRQGCATREALAKTMRILALPVILTSVTTSLGFLSLLSAPGVSIKNIGLFLAFGVMVAMLFSLVFIPAITSWYRQRRSSSPISVAKKVAERSTRFHDFAATAGTAIIRQKYTVTAVALIFLVVSIFGVLNTEVESDEVRYFKPSHPFRMATENIQRDLGGVTSLDIIVEGQEADVMKRPDLLRAIQDLQAFCEQDELVSYTLALPDFISRINYVLHDNDSAYERLPHNRETVSYEEYELINGVETLVEKTEEVSGFEQVAQFLLLYEMSGGDATDEYVDDAYQHARISVRLKDMSSRRLVALLDKIEPYIAEHFPADVNVRYSNHYIRVVMMQLIIDSQIYSLLTVLGMITLLMAIIFRSAIIGVLTAFPVFIAVLFNFAIMWSFGITLNIGTSIVASVGMGVGIDYAIHYFSRFRMLLTSREQYDTALIQAMSETSRAILSNASAVGLGFLALLFSEYRVVANIGWITAVSMFTTALGSLVILPALLSIVRPRVYQVRVEDTTTESSAARLSEA